MDNIFYAEPSDITGKRLELTGQEARHASKVLRLKVGDELFASEGLGNIYTTQIFSITKNRVIAEILDIQKEPKPASKKVIAFGAIKKRDRLEYAVEKAVELNAWEICIFHADHSERSRINQNRLQVLTQSAFKQCKRAWLPKIVYLDSLDEVLLHYADYHPIVAHMHQEPVQPKSLSNPKNLLLIGPEGGFSDREIKLAKVEKAEFVSLGKTRLRAETAVAALLSQYLFD